MGLFGESLGFDGRIGRLGYLWRSIVGASALAALAVAGIYLFTAVLQPSGVRAADIAPDAFTGVMLLGLWSAFALTTRRLRDMGFEPIYIVPVYAALWVVNSQILEPMSRGVSSLAAAESAWIALQWAAAVPLLLWPSRDRPQPKAAYGYEPTHHTAYLNWRESN
jgi:uncharacterized membrane protein YhaH (DUF805 family)